jgi:DNA-binding PadR family transcriptional regulator
VTAPLQEPTFLILAALAEAPMHGYGVIQEVATLSDGRVRLRPGTLYGALDRLVDQGLVTTDREEIVDGRLRRYYRLSEDGAGVLEARRNGWPATPRRRCNGYVAAAPGAPVSFMADVGDADGVKPTGVRLEQRCRRLLLAYPRDYRAQRGDEIVSTMLDAMPAGRRWPDPADAADVVAGGLRYRLGTASLVGFDEGLALAAPVALSLAAGIAGFAWWRVEPVTAGAALGGVPLFGLFRTLGPVAYAFWLLAAVGWAVLRPAPSRFLIAVSIAVTLALPAVAPLTGVDRPPLWVMAALAVFGLLALVGSAPASGGYRSTLDGRLSVPAGAVAVTVAASTVVTLWAPGTEAYGYYYQPTLARVGTVVTATVAVVAAIAIARQVRRRGAGGWLWAAALLGLPAGWMGPFDSEGLRTAATDTTPHFGRLAQVVLASCVAVTTIAWLARRGRPHTAVVPAAATVGTGRRRRARHADRVGRVLRPRPGRLARLRPRGARRCPAMCWLRSVCWPSPASPPPWWPGRRSE